MISSNVRLHSLVASIIKPNPPAADVRRFVHVCHSISRIYLNQKIHNGRLNPNFFAVPLDDLALDCIATLFERNERGEFVRLQQYFRSIDIETLCDDGSLMLTRRLVIGALNDEMFRMYRIEDPSLGNIIRSLKRAVKTLPNVFSERINGELWLYLQEDRNDGENLPIIPYDYLQLLLTIRFSETRSVRDLMHRFADIIEKQQHYSRRYPLVGLAHIIRTMHITLTDAEGERTVIPDESIRTHELHRYIHESIGKVKMRMRGRYVTAKNIKEETYDLLFDAIEEILVAQYVRNDGFDHTFYEYVKQYNPDITLSRYTETYRAMFEYLVKLSRTEFIENVQREYL